MHLLSESQATLNLEVLRTIMENAAKQSILQSGSDFLFEGEVKWNMPGKLEHESDRAIKMRTNPPTLFLCQADERLKTITLDREHVPFYGDIWLKAVFFHKHGHILAEHQAPPFKHVTVSTCKFTGKCLFELAGELPEPESVHSVMVVFVDEISGPISHRLFYRLHGGLNIPLLDTTASDRNSNVFLAPPASALA